MPRKSKKNFRITVVEVSQPANPATDSSLLYDFCAEILFELLLKKGIITVDKENFSNDIKIRRLRND